jgi:hypothetical protein
MCVLWPLCVSGLGQAAADPARRQGGAPEQGTGRIDYFIFCD